MLIERMRGWQMTVGIVLILSLLGWIDWQTGYELNFFAFYFLPVGLAAWRFGLPASVAASIAASFVWYAANAHQPYSSQLYAVWNTIIRLLSFTAMGWALAAIRAHIAVERATSAQLKRSLAEVTLLEGFLPICAQCKKIRDDNGEWQPMERYIGERTKARFSHGYCPECLQRVIEEAGLSLPPSAAGR